MEQATEAALLEFANELAEQIKAETGAKPTAQTVANNLRWYPNKAGAVVIVSRGKDRKVLATISPKAGKWSHLYPTWKPILAELEAKKATNNVSRLSHDGLLTGEIPQ